jgi:hypothetical protein
MNDYSISLERHIGLWIDAVSYTKGMVSIRDKIFIPYDPKIIFEVSMHNCIHIPVIWTTDVSGMNDIITGWISGVTLSDWGVSLLKSIYMYYDSKIIFAWFTDISIHIPTQWMTVESFCNGLFLTR